jgi:hypothetical protein
VTYTPTTWVDDTGSGNGTVLSAARLNNIESGIVGTQVAEVTTLPASPTDGQLVDLLVDAAAAYGGPYLWRCKYRAATPGTSRWHVIAAGPLFAEVTTLANITSGQTTYGNPTIGSGPDVALPVPGDYEVSIGVDFNRPAVANTVAYMSYAIGATAAVDADSVRLAQNDAATPGPSMNITKTRRKNGLGAVTLASKYRVSGAAVGALQDRWMRVWPVRIGP